MIKTITWLCSTFLVVITSLRAAQADESAATEAEWNALAPISEG